MGFNKTKMVDKKGESVIDKISELARKAETIADADSGGSETSRLKRMLDKVTDELDNACHELEKMGKFKADVGRKFAEAQAELNKAKDIAEKAKKDAFRLKELIKKYGELEKGLEKAVDKIIGDMDKIDDIRIEPPSEDFFE